MGRCVKSPTVKTLRADLDGNLPHLGVRTRQELVEHAEFGDEIERRGMDRVAAEIAQEVFVLLEHDHVDAGAGEQQRRHHSGGPPPAITQSVSSDSIGS